MSRILTALIVAALFTVSAFAGGSNAAAMGGKNQGKAGKQKTIPAPALKGAYLNGKGEFDLAALKGKVVLVNFWATWCPPCRAEIPDLVKIADENKDKLVIVGVSLDDSAETVKPFLPKNGMTYPNIMGSPEVTDLWGGVQAIPTSFVVDKSGNVLGKIVGARDYDSFMAILKPLLQ